MSEDSAPTKEDVQQTKMFPDLPDLNEHEVVAPTITETFNAASDDEAIDTFVTSTSFGDDEEIDKGLTFDDEMKYNQSATSIRGLNSPRNRLKKMRKKRKKPRHNSRSYSPRSPINTLVSLFKKISIQNKGRGRSELPSFATFCTFEWKNMNVWVGRGKKKKQILYDMNGSISSGQLMAIMGGSGAGKSTLLNILSGRTNLNKQMVSGTFAINKKTFDVSDQSIIKALCSFVPQSDVLCATQTVCEALSFYAKLKLSNKSPEKQMKRINYLMKVLHLSKCKDSMIGDMNESSANKGISGGERRRVSIAAEIINDVDIIFLDEPTSGLDAYTASATIKTLKEFCTVSNKIIIATIHQPSIETFYLFDKLLLLSRGRCCFNSKIQDVDIFFQHSLKPKTNPADVIVFEIQQNPEDYAQRWKASNLNTVERIIQNMRIMRIIQKEYADIQCEDGEEYADYTEDDLYNSHNNLTNAPRTFQLRLLLTREVQSLYRDKKVSLVRLGQVLFFALTCGVIYYQIEDSYAKKMGSFFVLTIIPLLFGMVSLLVVFPKQKVLFQREYNSNTYTLSMFALSFILIEIPREIIHMLIFNVIAYSLIGLDGHFSDYWVTLFLCSFSGGSFGMLFGVICATSDEAAQMVPASLIPILMFSDGMVPIEQLPGFLRWISNIDPMYFLFRCFMIIEFEGVTYGRKLRDVDQKFCNRYGNYSHYYAHHDAGVVLNCSVISDVNQSLPNIPNINGNITDIINNITNNYHLSNINDPKLVPFKTTIDQFYNFTSTMSEEQQQVEEFCRTDVPASYFFESRNLDPSDLISYWIIVLVISLSVRMISLMLLYIMNNNDVSITNIFCKMGKNVYARGQQLYEDKFQNKSSTTEKPQTIKKQISKTVLSGASMKVHYDEQAASESDEELDANGVLSNKQQTFV